MATTNRAPLIAPGARLLEQGLPVVVILAAVVLAWYGLAWWFNAPGAIERVLEPKGPWNWQDLFSATMAMERPVIPAPHQVALDLWSSVFGWPVDSPPESPSLQIVGRRSNLVLFLTHSDDANCATISWTPGVAPWDAAKQCRCHGDSRTVGLRTGWFRPIHVSRPWHLVQLENYLVQIGPRFSFARPQDLNSTTASSGRF